MVDQTKDASTLSFSGNFEALLLKQEEFSGIDPALRRDLTAGAYRNRITNVLSILPYVDNPELYAKMVKEHDRYRHGLEETLARSLDGVQVTAEEIEKARKSMAGASSEGEPKAPQADQQPTVSTPDKNSGLYL